MNRVYSRALVLALFSLLLPTLATAASGSDIQQLMERSGLTRQVQEYPGLVKTGMQQALQQDTSGKIPQESIQAMLSAADRAFSSQEMLGGIAKDLSGQLDARHLPDLMKWYNSAAGRKIAQMESAASTPQAYAEMMQSAQQLLANQSRVKMIREIDQTISATDSSVKLMMNMQVASVTSLMSVMSPGVAVSVDEIREKFAGNEAQMRPQIEQVVTVSLLYSYRKLSKPELTRYLAFLRTPAAQAYNRLALDSIDRQLTLGMERFGVHLMHALKDTKA